MHFVLLRPFLFLSFFALKEKCCRTTSRRVRKFISDNFRLIMH